MSTESKTAQYFTDGKEISKFKSNLGTHINDLRFFNNFHCRHLITCTCNKPVCIDTVLHYLKDLYQSTPSHPEWVAHNQRQTASIGLVNQDIGRHILLNYYPHLLTLVIESTNVVPE